MAYSPYNPDRFWCDANAAAAARPASMLPLSTCSSVAAAPLALFVTSSTAPTPTPSCAPSTNSGAVVRSTAATPLSAGSAPSGITSTLATVQAVNAPAPSLSAARSRRCPTRSPSDPSARLVPSSASARSTTSRAWGRRESRWAARDRAGAERGGAGSPLGPSRAARARSRSSRASRPAISVVTASCWRSTRRHAGAGDAVDPPPAAGGAPRARAPRPAVEARAVPSSSPNCSIRRPVFATVMNLVADAARPRSPTSGCRVREYPNIDEPVVTVETELSAAPRAEIIESADHPSRSRTRSPASRAST